MANLAYFACKSNQIDLSLWKLECFFLQNEINGYFPVRRLLLKVL